VHGYQKHPVRKIGHATTASFPCKRPPAIAGCKRQITVSEIGCSGGGAYPCIQTGKSGKECATPTAVGLIIGEAHSPSTRSALGSHSCWGCGGKAWGNGWRRQHCVVILDIGAGTIPTRAGWRSVRSTGLDCVSRSNDTSSRETGEGIKRTGHWSIAMQRHRRRNCVLCSLEKSFQLLQQVRPSLIHIPNGATETKKSREKNHIKNITNQDLAFPR
jgi:hypothetical protein